MSRSEEVRGAQRAYKPDMETDVKEAMERLAEALGLAANGLCPECKEPMHEKQVGRCVYAQPCGHRLYQGKARKIRK